MKPDGGPAFPGATPKELGMSLRDYFAAKAMASEINCTAGNTIATDLKALATWSYAVADAMLEQRLL